MHVLALVLVYVQARAHALALLLLLDLAGALVNFKIVVVLCFLVMRSDLEMHKFESISVADFMIMQHSHLHSRASSGSSSDSRRSSDNRHERAAPCSSVLMLSSKSQHAHADKQTNMQANQTMSTLIQTQ